MNGFKTDCLMKHYTKLFFAAAVAALGLASCAKEVAPVETPKDNLVTVHFGATAGIEGATKATLTPNEQETLFTSAWENGDVLSVDYSNDNGTAGTKGTVSASWATDHFEAKMPEYHGMWIYNVVYPAPDTESAVDFGSARTQKGNAYNSKYDLMKGSAIEENADAGKTADGKEDIVFNMTRQTAIAYFHFTSALDEKVVSAKLSVTDGNIASSLVMLLDHTDGFDLSTKDLNEITITFEEGTAPKASNFQLWFNVLPTTYTSMSLEVKTANHTLTLNKNKEGNFVAGKLYKIHKSDVTWTENKNVTFFYESFDSCDGTGGNDGKWSGQIASNTLETKSLDNPSWAFENEKSANKCARLGTGDKAGKATTPALGINTSTATLSFKAGAWNVSSESTTINVTANNGGTVEPSTITLKKGEWTDYTCTISEATENTTLTFAASQEKNNRFFLDEVMVYYGNKPVVAKKLEQNIAFEKGNYSVLLANKDSFESPKVNGNKTPVSYSITLGEGVAQDAITIDPTTGEITINAVGTATITATAEETEEYEAASANYALTVTTEPTYKKYDGTLTKCPFSANIKTASINGLTWTLDTDNAGYYYYDNGGIHLGSKSKSISYATFTLDYTSYCGKESVNGVKNITVTCKAGGNNAKVEVFVGSTPVGSKNINNTMTDYAFELKEVAFGNVIVKISQTKATKAIYIGGVIIN